MNVEDWMNKASRGYKSIINKVIVIVTQQDKCKQVLSFVNCVKNVKKVAKVKLLH